LAGEQWIYGQSAKPGATMTTTIRARERAKTVLAGQHETPEDLIKLIDRLKSEQRFSLARSLPERLRFQREVASSSELRLVVGKKPALVGYKDAVLPIEMKFERTLVVLRSADDLERTKDQETLGF
jgi:hypothetical protein